VVRIAVRDMLGEALVNVAGTHDQQVIARRQPVRDLLHEALQVLQAMWLTNGVGAATAVTDRGIVPDVAGGPVVRWDVGLHATDPNVTVMQLRDDGFTRVDPHEGAGWPRLVARARGAGRRWRHDRAHAGPASASLASSA
jgi:hypothetical protein